MEKISAHNKYLPAIDGLRAVAVATVMFFHAAPHDGFGFLGVDVFFVISGFLITGLLHHEIQQTGSLNFARFYMRRFFRLTPALLFMLAAYLVASPILWPENDAPWLDALLSALYIADYSAAFWGLPSELKHAWSLSVEEHFYLLWPPLFLMLARRFNVRQLICVLTLLYLATTLSRYAWVGVHNWSEIYYRFDTRASGMMLGALLAVLISQHRDAFLKSKLPLVVVAVALFLVFDLKWGNRSALAWGMTTAEIGAAAMIICAIGSGPLTKLLSAAPLIVVGKLSYGLYLWHYPIFKLLRENLSQGEVLAIGVPISFALALFSYATVERIGYAVRERLEKRLAERGVLARFWPRRESIPQKNLPRPPQPI